MEIQVYADGGSRGNPGWAGAGILLRKHQAPSTKSQTEAVEEDNLRLAIYLGDKLTNNQAEYLAVIAALKYIHKNFNPNKIKRVSFCLDSELIVKQLNGEYRVKDKTLKQLHERIRVFKNQFKVIEYKHVKREENKEADRLVNLVLDLRESL